MPELYLTDLIHLQLMENNMLVHFLWWVTYKEICCLQHMYLYTYVIHSLPAPSEFCNIIILGLNVK